MIGLVESTRWHGPHWRGHLPQLVPSLAELLQAGAVATGDCLPDYEDEDSLPAGRDKQTWYIESPGHHVILLLVPDKRGFYLEDEHGDRWRPACLREILEVLRSLEIACETPLLH